MSHTSLRPLEKKQIFEKLGIKNICIDNEGAKLERKIFFTFNLETTYTIKKSYFS